MKRLTSILLFFTIFITAVPVFAVADATGKTLDVHGVYVPHHINDKGILQITLTEQTEAQILDRLRDNKKKDQNLIEIDLTGFENLNGFTLLPSSWSAIKVKLFKDVTVFISSHTAMLIEDNSSGGDVLLEVAYSFTKEKQVSGLDLRLTDESGYEIETVGVVSFPTEGYDFDLQNIALSCDGEIIVKSCVLDGLFYAAVSLSGEYMVVEAQPAEFKDEIPAWAKCSIDWMSARGVIKGSDGLFRANDGITRAEFMTMFARLYNVKSSEISPHHKFQDMHDIPEWAILWIAPSLFFDVKEGGFLYPNKVMTCGEVMKAIHGYIAFFDLFFDEDPNKPAPFVDSDDAGSHEPEAHILSQRGILSGDGGKADMDEFATRAQAAELFCRFAKWETFNRTYK